MKHLEEYNASTLTNIYIFFTCLLNFNEFCPHHKLNHPGPSIITVTFPSHQIFIVSSHIVALKGGATKTRLPETLKDS